MKGKLFLRVGLLLFAAVLLGSAMTYAAVQPQLAGTEARAQALSHLLWVLPIALFLAAAGGWAIAVPAGRGPRRAAEGKRGSLCPRGGNARLALPGGRAAGRDAYALRR